MSVTEPVPTEIWQPDPDRPGYLTRVRARTVSEVFADLSAAVGQYPHGGEEYFSPAGVGGPEQDWPDGRTVVFAVRGSSEGDYVHVEVLDDRQRELVLLAKTFEGRDAAWQFARRLADLLDV